MPGGEYYHVVRAVQCPWRGWRAGPWRRGLRWGTAVTTTATAKIGRTEIKVAGFVVVGFCNAATAAKFGIERCFRPCHINRLISPTGRG